MDLYLYKYNNAYNKIVRKKDALTDYAQYQIGTTLQNINFNPNDGVTTEQIINWNYDVPDYLIAAEGNTISSRWFVMEAQRTRNMQLRLSLLRDVISDHYDAVMQSKCFVQKGFVQNSSPLIFNNENMGFNQIKKGETLLKNNLETPWLVLYLARYNNEGEYNSFTGSFVDVPAQVDYELTNLSDYKYYNYSQEAIDAGTGTELAYIPQNRLQFYVPFNHARYGIGLHGVSNAGAINIYNPAGGTIVVPPGNYPTWDDPNTAPGVGSGVWDDLVGLYNQGFGASTDGIAINSYDGTIEQSAYNLLTRENGKVISAGGKNYRINVSWVSAQKLTTIQPSSALGLEMTQALYTEAGMDTTGHQSSYYTVSDRQPNQNVDNSFLLLMEFVETNVSDITYDYNIAYEKTITKDAVYEILAAPLYDITFTDGSETINHAGDIALQWFQDVINKYNASNFAYDIQIVPYCQIDQTNITDFEKTYCVYNNAGVQTKQAVAFMLPSASFSLQLDVDIEFNSDYKISNETERFRFVSPGGVGEYEFSPSKNGGLSGIEVDCTLIPFNPYIKINPIFGNLYGQDFNDYRGLICSGDFSLPILSNSWETYQLNNKYYQDIFNRKIENQEYNNKWQLASNIAGAAAGVGAGAVAGGIIGGPIGAVAGGLLSAAGGITDVIAGQAMFREGIDYQRDMFGYELGTMKARSESLTRTTSYNINNKYFPYVEYYACTETEVQALENKIAYNGMTVGVIGTLSEYLNPTETSFFQGQLIEIDITDDAHMAHEIARVLQEGRRFEH